MAVSSLAREGPEVLRSVLKGCDESARLLGFEPAMDAVRQQLADPTSDRVIEVLLIAYAWGGDLVVDVLTDLASEISEDLRTEQAIRAEGTTQRVEAWVVGVVPWFLLVYLTSTQGEYRLFYQSGLGRTVVIGAGLWWGFGLIILSRLRRREAEPRVLAAGGEVTAT
jgi:tight adherence protein B